MVSVVICLLWFDLLPVIIQRSAAFFPFSLLSACTYAPADVLLLSCLPLSPWDPEMSHAFFMGRCQTSATFVLFSLFPVLWFMCGPGSICYSSWLLTFLILMELLEPVSCLVNCSFHVENYVLRPVWCFFVLSFALVAVTCPWSLTGLTKNDAEERKAMALW